MFGQWKNEFTVTFDSQGGSTVTAATVESGKIATLPTAPTKEGFTFGGWYKEAACTNVWTFATDTVTANTTLYAKWTENTPPTPAATITGIAVDATSTQVKSFVEGTDFSSIGLVIKATYSGTTTAMLATDKYTVDSSAYIKNTPGTYVITITLSADTTKTVSYNVTVTAKTVTSIAVTSTSSHKTDFPKGTAFSFSGLIIEASYNNNSTAILTADKYDVDNSAFNASAEGNYTITVKLNADTTKTTTYTVHVTAAVITGIAVDTTSTQVKSFVEGTDFSSTGLVIKATYSDTTTAMLATDKYTVNSSAYIKNTPGTYAITITLKADTTKTVSYNVTVTAKVVTSIAVKADSAHKTDFPRGTAFSFSGLIIEATYGDNSTAILTADKYTITCANFDANAAAGTTYTVTAKLKSNETKTTTYTVTVTAKAITGISIKTAATQTEFIVGKEVFNNTGLAISATFSDGTVEDLVPGTYTVDDTAFNNQVVGNYNIIIKLNANATITVNYSVSVIAIPFEGTYFSYMADNNGTETDMVYYDFVLENGMFYNMNSTDKTPYTFSRNQAVSSLL